MKRYIRSLQGMAREGEEWERFAMRHGHASMDGVRGILRVVPGVQGQGEGCAGSVPERRYPPGALVCGHPEKLRWGASWGVGCI